MINNDILRRLRYAFHLNDDKVIALFASADKVVTRSAISNWLKKDDDPAFVLCNDIQLATFLNGFINDKRGKKDGAPAKAEKLLTNNLIFRKLRIALNLKDIDILYILSLVDYKLSKHELSAFFRKPEHRQYRLCKDQILRNFLHGLQVKYRPTTTEQSNKKNTTPSTVQPKENQPTKKQAERSQPVSKPVFQWKQD